jgi:hypothetical protein
MERNARKHQKEPGHQTCDTASPVDEVRSPDAWSREHSVTSRIADDIDPEAEAVTPTALHTPQAAGLAGVMFAVLTAVIIVLIRKNVPADPHAAGEWLTSASSRRQVQIALGLVPFCGIFFLWFMGAVRDRIGDLEDKFFGTIFLGSGLLFIAMLFVFAAIYEALIELAGLHDGRPPLDLWQLGRSITLNVGSYDVRMAGVFMIAASTIAFRLRIHSRMISIVGYAAALLLLFGSTSIPWLQLVMPFWVLLVSINIVILTYRGAGGARTAAARRPGARAAQKAPTDETG